MKRNPDGSLDKHKARVCPHGGMQRWGVYYWKTFSPVVSWLPIHLMFVFCITCNLASMSLDFAQVFSQADIKNDVLMQMTFAYDDPNGDHTLRLKRISIGYVMAI